MGVLSDRIDKQLAMMQDERGRIMQQAKADVAEVEAKVDALTTARKAITPDVELAYITLKVLGFTKDL